MTLELLISNSCPSSEPDHRDFLALLPELLRLVTANLTAPDVKSASMVCKSWCVTLQPLREAMVCLKRGIWFANRLAGVRPSPRIPSELGKALEMFLKGAELGSAQAMVAAGLVYWKIGRREDAIAMNRRAAALGNSSAQCNLGVYYSHAEPPNLKEAIKWLYKASFAGHAGAQHHLSLCLYRERGNLTRAARRGNLMRVARWCLRAAQGGHVGAMYNASLFYSSGKGLVQSHRQAREWMRMAADGGHSKAQLEYGRSLMKEGKMIRAAVYLEIASRAGETDADHYKDMAYLQISVENYDIVHALVQEWLQNH